MRRSKLLSLVLFFSIISVNTLFAQFEIPELTHGDSLFVAHEAYSLSYNEDHEQANWVAYKLLREKCIKNAARSNRFVVDKKVKTGTANNADYLKSGYDRGHLAPAADMAWSEISMQESFYYSNMSPQTPGFNRGIWKNLEDQVREWAKQYDSIYIVTGPILTDSLPTIGPNKVSIPAYYYKVVADINLKKGIAFLLPNNSSSLSLQSFVVSIDDIESLTGINFFPLLTETDEYHIESLYCIPCWTWKRKD